MAKAKKFNIESFVDDAAEGVQVAHEQRLREEEEKLQEMQRVQQQMTMQSAMALKPVQQPSANYSGVGEMMMPTNMATPVAPAVPEKEEEKQKGKRGRRKSLRTIERVNGKIVFLEKEMDANLAKLSTFERFDKQDIIRTALFQWMEAHFDGMMLDNEGRREVIEYIQRTTTFEDL